MRAFAATLMLTSFVRASRLAFSCSPGTSSPCSRSRSGVPSAAMSALSSCDVVEGDTIGGEGITLVPSGGQYKNIVVWLHGLGDTASGWSSTMEQLRFSDTKFILPTAKTRPITLNGGFPMPGWSDIKGLSKDSPEDTEGFTESTKRVRDILESEKAKGKELKRMVVGGFSQGGAVALNTCLRSTDVLAGCVACSAWVPMNKEYPGARGSAAQSIPIAQFHGTRDEVVPFVWGQHSYNLMKDALGMTVDFVSIPGMGHSACEEELEGIRDFLKKILPE